MRLACASVVMLLAALLVPAAASAQTECTRRVVERAVPGGEGQPGVVLDCDTTPDAGLLAPDAAAAVCVGASDPSLPPGSLEACQEAVASAQKLLRRAKIRAALREGVADAAIQQSFDATLAELDALRESALLSAPLAGGP